MSKTLKKLLVILIVLASIILAIPKLEEAKNLVIRDDCDMYGVDPANIYNYPNPDAQEGDKYYYEIKELINNSYNVVNHKWYGKLSVKWKMGEIEELRRGDYFAIGREALGNGSLYCIEELQGIATAQGKSTYYPYQLYKIVEIEDNTVTETTLKYEREKGDQIYEDGVKKQTYHNEYKGKENDTSHKITDIDAINLTKGLVYLLSNANEEYENPYSDWDQTGTHSDLQQMVWVYLGWARDKFELKDEVTSNAFEADYGLPTKDNEEVDYWYTPKGQSIFTNALGTDWDFTENEDMIKAKNIALGNTTYNIQSAKLYEMIGEGDTAQVLIIVKEVTEYPEFKLNLNKTDSITGNSLDGAKFNITLDGVDVVNGNQATEGKYILNNYNLNENATLNITPSVVTGKGEVTITLEETKAPNGYDKLDVPIKIHIDTQDAKPTNVSVLSGKEYINIDKNTMTIDIKNYKTIKVNGYVFLDGQFGDKAAYAPNGIFDGNDTKVEGVKVELWVKRGTNSSYSMEKSTNTDTNGAYKFNIDNGQNVKDYIIRFIYNGVEYEDTIYYKSKEALSRLKDLPNVSKAEENARIRTTFNTRFSEITLNNNKEGKQVHYGNWTRTNRTQIGTSKLNISMAGYGKNGNVVDSAANYYQMYADTEAYTESRNDLNFGIKERGMDLALTMNVDHTDVSINGKTTTYDYTDININTNEELEKWLNSVLADNKVNVDVYPTDYYYRIADYANGGISNILKDDSMTKEYAKNPEDELNVKITYKVRMFNQTAGIDAHIKQLVYYYNNGDYTLNSVVDGAGNSYNWSSANNNYGTIAGYSGIVITGNWDVSNNDQYLYLTFTVNKNNGIFRIGTVNGNIVAITSYSSKDGLLDSDSSTRSIVSGKDIQYEDDTARAEDVNINISSKVRKISGNVFNDLDKAGVLDDGEAINDVVVQLIEITKNNNEYIWQETKAGSNSVTSLVRLNAGDLTAYTYNNNVGNNETGKYEFLNIVPGNYIVRFIYGDGYNYDITVNNTKYNGADYKSTVDPNYKSEWYNTATYSANASVARDNEARRLGVMGAMAEIDSGLGTALDVYAKNKQDLTSVERENILNYLTELNGKNDNEFNAALNYLKTSKGNNDSWNTWKNNALSNISDQDLLVLVKKCIAYKTFMAAETSKVNVPIDVSNSNALKTDSGSTIIRLTRNNNYRIVNYNISNISFANVNFGITLRPQVKFELEKHITALKVAPNGTGVAPVLDASANIADILRGDIKTSGENKGLATIKSTRDNRGWWKLETKTSELEQGANLEVEYTYVVRNTGDTDFVSPTLATTYQNDIGNYATKLNEFSRSKKSSAMGKTHTYGEYLGEYYYTGNKGTSDVEVKSRVEEFGEALNNKLRYDENTSGAFFEKANVNNANKEIRNIYNTDGVMETEEIDTVVKTKSPSNFDKTDTSKTLKLTTVLASLNLDGGENIPSYIAEILKYSSASGGRNTEATPGNLNYVHSKDNEMELDNSYIYEIDGKMYETQDINSVPEGATNVRKANEKDEFWGETIMIGEPTGENKVLLVQIGITALAVVAVIGTGIVLIKKFVLKK